MKNHTTLTIDGKKIDLADYLNTLTPNNTEYTAIIKVADYEELGSFIFSLIGVCQTALHSFKDNSELTEYQKENYLGASSLSIIKVLEIAKNLLPLSEFELLEKLNKANKITNP